jgi:hypothetical protein
MFVEKFMIFIIFNGKYLHEHFYKNKKLFNPPCQHEWELSGKTYVDDGYRRALFVAFVCKHCGANKREARLGYSLYPKSGCLTCFDLGKGYTEEINIQTMPYSRHCGRTECGNVKQIYYDFRPS